ncbi:MAG: DUF368 domain-containing protein [Gammaproteobacteria bacterium AqS3]|nr:DUF368 domain-containing protein [Gammaproteobacteria bacterium AqS3]
MARDLKRSLRVWSGWFGRGVAMGCAELAPGVSGGTVALITGIYYDILRVPKLVLSLNWWALLLQRPYRALALMRFGVLLCLLLGMAGALWSLSVLVQWLFREHPSLILGFFAGLVLAGALVVARPLDQRHRMLGLPSALLLGLLLYSNPQFALPQEPVWIVMAGALGSSAWVLPGISGALVLLLLGMYEPALEWVRTLDWGHLGWLVLGAGLGALLIGRLIGVLWEHHRAPLSGVLVGLMLGSLVRLMPPEPIGLTTLALGLLAGWLLGRAGE